MLKFNEFINESFDLILESEVYFSDNFIKILKKMKNPLAKEILDLHKADLNIINNFFDVNLDNNSKIFFIPDRKAQQILSNNIKYVKFIGQNGGWLKHSEANQNIFDLLGYKADGAIYRPNSIEIGEVKKEYKSPKTGKLYYYVKFSDGSGVYNAEKLEEIKDITNKIFSLVSNKQELNIGRAMKALLNSANVEFLNPELEKFVNEYKSLIDIYGGIFSNFELVSGREIAFWYNEENYLVSGTPTLGTSCMRDVDDDYFDIYTMNPEVCSLLILKDEKDKSKIIARALLWTTNQGDKFLDRIYTINDSDVNLFKQYAKINGWYSKQINNSSASSYVDTPTDSSKYISIKVDIKHNDYDYYPYLDTLKYFSPQMKTLSNDESAGSLRLEEVDGSYNYCENCENTGVMTCPHCGGDGEEACDNCSGTSTVTCEDCGGDGKQGCYQCDRSGRVECDECDGDGEITDSIGDLVECNNCDGEGSLECNNCDGEGYTECDDCDGSGEIECDSCGGQSTVSCSRCDGSGETDCDSC